MLYDILPRDGEEFTVHDKDYESEYYFYFSDNENDKWDVAMMNLAKKLTVKDNTVNLSELIERKLPELSDLFIECDIDSIKDDMENILAGNVSEKWLETFVERL